MKRLELNQMEVVLGGGSCEKVAGTITGVGLGAFYFPTPLSYGFGIAVTGLGLLATYACMQ
jgi:hypothetical protein